MDCLLTGLPASTNKMRSYICCCWTGKGNDNSLYFYLIFTKFLIKAEYIAQITLTELLKGLSLYPKNSISYAQV